MHARRLWGWGAGLVVMTLAAAVAYRGLAPAPVASSGSTADATLKGTVFYRERIALPANSTVEVVLEDVSVAGRPAVEIARATVMPAGQVPIPFALRYARDRIETDHRYSLRAAVLWPNGARMFVSADAHPVLDGVVPNAGLTILVQRVSETEAADAGRRFLFECGDNVFFAVRVAAGSATLSAPKFFGNDSIVLQQTEAASGARYAVGDTVFWSKGDVATFQIGGKTFIDCMAARSGR